MACGARESSVFGAVLIATMVALPPAGASGPLAMVVPTGAAAAIFEQVLRDPPAADDAQAEIPARLRRQPVTYPTREAPGTLVIDTANTYLCLVLGGGRAMRYAIGVGRDGFAWAGVHSVSHKAEWPDWIPPAEMIARQKYLPRWVAGGPGNPLGARAIYLGATQYRIHGTNDPTTIGQRVSSGCFRMTNEDVIDLYGRVNLGSKVVVLSDTGRRAAGEHPAPPNDRQTSLQPPLSPRPSTGAAHALAFGLY
jgi:lipoprotein-anchoring transpeptidase ErfK/SrfK